MFVFDKAFIKVDGQIVELPIGNNVEVPDTSQYWQSIYTTDVDMPVGSTLELPKGVYNADTDLLVVNHGGFILIESKQYTESNGIITFLIDIPQGNKLSITAIKTGACLGKLSQTWIDWTQYPGIADDRKVIITANGDEFYRHVDGDSCVLKYKDGDTRVWLRVFDSSKCRVSIFTSVGSNTPFTNFDDMICASDAAYSDTNNAKYNTDALYAMYSNLQDSVARPVIPVMSRMFGGDCPTINEIKRIFANLTEIEANDPAFASSSFTISSMFTNFGYMWTSNIAGYGTVNGQYVVEPWAIDKTGNIVRLPGTGQAGVVPVLELNP